MKGKINMSKSQKKKRRTGEHRISMRDVTLRTQSDSLQQRIKNEKERMLSILNFDKHLHEQVEDMFTINLKDMSAGQEPMFFSTAMFKIDSAEQTMRKIEQLNDINLADEEREGKHYIWTREYPKGHWNPMSTMPGARQIIGNIHVNFDNTLKLETKTKGWMTGLIYYMIKVLGKEIRLINLEFLNPLEILRKKL